MRGRGVESVFTHYFYFSGAKTVIFFLCTVERYSIIKSVFLHKFKSYNKEIGKPDESLGRKATGPVKWQPVAKNEVHCLFDSVFLRSYFTDVTIMILSGKNEENKSMKKAKRCLIAVLSGVFVATAVLAGCGQ